jgi:hypothetical protein
MRMAALEEGVLEAVMGDFQTRNLIVLVLLLRCITIMLLYDMYYTVYWSGSRGSLYSQNAANCHTQAAHVTRICHVAERISRRYRSYR